MRSERFRAAVLESLAGAHGTYIYEAVTRDLEDKTNQADPCGYRNWLDGLIRYLGHTYSLARLRILDVGCGTGELTVLMNLLGHDATGVEVNGRQLDLARLLATENGIDPSRFVLANGRQMPFEDQAFDIITMISCLEHMDDDILDSLVPELGRICRGVIFVQVPTPMKLTDDHTGLRFVPWMPGWLAKAYVAARGPRYRYAISSSGRWDVVYRSLREIERRFRDFSMEMVPPKHSFPQCDESDAVLDLRGNIRVGRRTLPVRIPLPHRRFSRWRGERIQEFLPYYNIVFRR